MEKITPFCPFPGCQRRGRPCLPCSNGEKDPWREQAAARAKAGRPKDDARELAKLCGDRTFHGGPCKNCEGTERYTKNGACVHCARSRSVEGHRARQALAHDWHTKERVSCAKLPEQSQGDEAIGTHGTRKSQHIRMREDLSEEGKTRVPRVPMPLTDSDGSGSLAHDAEIDVCQPRTDEFTTTEDDLRDLLDGPRPERYLRPDEIPQPWD